MKLRLTGATFDASAQTITHTSFSDVTLAGIQLITNVTDQIIIYNFADTTKGGTLSTDTLTLEYDTTSMSDTDELMILVEDGTATTAINDGGNTITVDGTVAVTGVATAANQTTIIGHVDGIETLIGTTNSTLTTIDGRVDGLETLVGTTNTTLTTIDGRVDGIEGLLTTIDSDTGTIATEVAGLLTDTELRATPVPVSGTVTANLSATDNAVLDDIALDTEAIKTSLAGTLTVTGGGGGVEYTEGDTDATIVGSAIMFESNTGTNTLSAVSNTTPLPISDAGGAITVDGTVAVTNAGITTIAGAVSGTEMQVDVLTMPTVTVTASNLDVQSGGADLATSTQAGAIQTSVELIGDAVYTDGTGTVTKGIAILGQDGTNPQAIKTDASGELQVDVLSMPTTAVTGTFWQATQPVSLTSTTVTGTVAVTQSGTWDEVGINDSGNSLTVDAPVGTPVFVRMSNGADSGDLPIEGDTSAQLFRGFTVFGKTSGNVAKQFQTDADGQLQVDVLTMPTVAVTQSGTWDEVGINDSGNSITVDQPTGTNLHTVVDSGTVTTVTTLTGGGIAHDSADSGNPVKVGGQARTTNPTAVADADRSNFITDKLGKQIVVGSIRDLKANQVTTITSSTSETTIVTAVGSTFLDMYGLIISNTSATAVNVAIKDATAGTTRFNFSVPAGDTRGFMLPEGGAIKQSAVNNNWTATSSASVASLVITALTVANT